jgi:hypothetical protein
VRFDNYKYSVSASTVGRPVEIHAYADRIVIRQDGRIVAEHPRSYEPTAQLIEALWPLAERDDDQHRLTASATVFQQAKHKGVSARLRSTPSKCSAFEPSRLHLYKFYENTV